MQTDLYTITIPPLIKSLNALAGILDKAAAHADTRATERQPSAMRRDALLNDRIVFDQFPLVRQIQIATDNAKGAVGRITGKEVPVFEDNEKTVEELKTRLAKTVVLLESVKPEEVNGKEDARVTLPYYKDQYMTALDYVTAYLLPNFYFHVATAYAIIRKNGVIIGKSDYIGPLPLKS